MTSSEQLERALRCATREPGARPALYRELLRSEVFVLATAPDGVAATLWNSKIVAWIRFDGVHVIPCFTTIKKARKAAESGHFAYKVKIRSLFEANKECDFHLNPNSEFDLKLSTNDVSSLLERGTVNLGVTRSAMNGDIQLKRSGDELVAVASALTVLLAQYSDIKQAYFFEVEQMSSGYQALVIGILASKDDKTLVQAISTILLDTYSGRLPIDVCFMLPNGAELSALKRASVDPFYDRDWGNRLVDLDIRLQ